MPDYKLYLHSLTTMNPSKTKVLMTPLDRAIRGFRNQCLPDCNKVRMARIENYLTIVYEFKSIETSTPEQQREYYKASRVLFQV